MVTSDKVTKTRKVTFEYLARHAKYNKYVKRQTVLHVHDEKNECRVGDQVEVMAAARSARPRRGAWCGSSPRARRSTRASWKAKPPSMFEKGRSRAGRRRNGSGQVN